MSGFDLFPQDQDVAMATAQANPATDLDAGFTQSFADSWNAHRATAASNSEQNNRYSYVQGVLDKLYSTTGESFPNPEGMQDWQVTARGGAAHTGARSAAYAKVQNRLQQLEQSNPEAGLGTLSPDEVAQGTLDYGKQAVADDAKSANGRVSWASSLGSFAGGMGAGMTDPVNAIATLGTLPLGGEGGLVTQAATQAGIAGVSEIASQSLNYDYRKKIDPNFTLAQSMGEVGQAVAGGAILGATPKVLSKLWAGAKSVLGYVPDTLKDSGNVVARAAVPEEPPVVNKTAESDNAHAQSVSKASEDVMASRPVELPPEAFLSQSARPGRVYDSSGRSVGVNYEVTEAANLRTSHDDSFRPNADYPPELQPRDRERAITQEQVSNMAQNLQPERLGPSPQADSGAPIVGPDGIVESGNGRVMAIRQAHEANNVASNNYRNYLTSAGYDVSGMDAPVLVARRVTDLSDADRVNFVNDANRATAMRLSAPEQAKADARLVDPGMVKLLGDTDVSSAGNRDFVRAFLGKLPRAEQGDLVDGNGVLSVEGRQRINNALMARAYGDQDILSRALEHLDNNIKTIGSGMVDAAPAWARMRDAVAEGRIPQQMDITKDLSDAIHMVMDARDKGVPLNDVLKQGGLFNEHSDIAEALTRYLYKDGDLTKPIGREKFSNMLRSYAQEAEKNLSGDRLFGDALSARDVFNSTLDASKRGDLQLPSSEVAESIKPENVEKLSSAPKTTDAVMMEGNRLMAAEATGQIPPIMVPHEEVAADGTVTQSMRSLSDILDEADKEIEAGQKIEACVSGNAIPENSQTNAGDLHSILSGNRKFETDAEGNITGLSAGGKVERPDPEMLDLLDSLSAPKKFNVDAEGNVKATNK